MQRGRAQDDEIRLEYTVIAEIGLTDAAGRRWESLDFTRGAALGNQRGAFAFQRRKNEEMARPSGAAPAGRRRVTVRVDRSTTATCPASISGT